MSNTSAQAQDPVQPHDRRLYARQPIRTLAYVELDEGNGGIILNISEGGLLVQAVTSLMDDLLPGVRFQLSEADGWVEANARLTWTTKSRKLAGLEFVDLAEASRDRIRRWLVRESLPAEVLAEAQGPSADELPSEEDSELGATTGRRFHTVASAAVAEGENVKLVPDAAPPVENELATPIAPLPVAVSSIAADAFATIVEPRRESEPVQVAQRARASATSDAGVFDNKWALAGVLAILAVGSLGAGWAAGQGGFEKFFERFRNAALPDIAANHESVPPPASAAARISEIEVLDASNHRWTIPFDGPLNSAEPGIRREAASGNSPQSGKLQTGFRTWILAAPRLTRAAGDAAEPSSASPPVVANAPAASENVLSPSGSANSPSLGGPVNLRKPDPPPVTGVVKPAELLHQVNPEYPKLARAQRVEGTVRLNVTIGADGVVRSVTVLGGPLLLTLAAEEAVRQWRYSPTLLDGKPIEVQKEVDLRFHFTEAQR
jgi:TonB family protein